MSCPQKKLVMFNSDRKPKAENRRYKEDEAEEDEILGSQEVLFRTSTEAKIRKPSHNSEHRQKSSFSRTNNEALPLKKRTSSESKIKKSMSLGGGSLSQMTEDKKNILREPRQKPRFPIGKIFKDENPESTRVDESECDGGHLSRPERKASCAPAAHYHKDPVLRPKQESSKRHSRKISERADKVEKDEGFFSKYMKFFCCKL